MRDAVPVTRTRWAGALTPADAVVWAAGSGIVPAVVMIAPAVWAPHVEVRPVAAAEQHRKIALGAPAAWWDEVKR
jgi:hypothetical protein